MHSGYVSPFFPPLADPSGEGGVSGPNPVNPCGSGIRQNPSVSGYLGANMLIYLVEKKKLCRRKKIS